MTVKTVNHNPTGSGGDFLPPADNTYNLGSTSFSWKELHVETVVYATSVAGNWSPSADDTYDLGTALLQWRNLYVDGVAYVDSLQSDGIAYIGDTADTNVTIGLVINQGEADNHILTLKSSDVAHAVVSSIEADTYGFFKKVENNAGGLRICGFSDSDSTTKVAIELFGYPGVTLDTTHSTAGRSMVEISGLKAVSGADPIAANSNIFGIRPYQGAGAYLTVFMVDVEGDIWSNGGIAANGALTGITNAQFTPATGASVNVGTSCNFKRFYSEVTLATDNAETDVGLTPAAVILTAAIRVSVEIQGLDSADHHIQLGINGSAAKYVDVAQGSAATTISVNKKGNYKFDPSTGTEAAALKLTITGGADQTPTAGKVYVEVIYLESANLADV